MRDIQVEPDECRGKPDASAGPAFEMLLTNMLSFIVHGRCIEKCTEAQLCRISSGDVTGTRSSADATDERVYRGCTGPQRRADWQYHQGAGADMEEAREFESLPLTANHQHALSQSARGSPADRHPFDSHSRMLRKRQMIPCRASVNGVSRKHRIDPRVERHVASEPKESIGNVAKRTCCHSALAPTSQRTRNRAISSNPHARPSVVFKEKWIPASADPAAGLEAAEGNRHRTIEFNGRRVSRLPTSQETIGDFPGR